VPEFLGRGRNIVLHHLPEPVRALVRRRDITTEAPPAASTCWSWTSTRTHRCPGLVRGAGPAGRDRQGPLSLDNRVLLLDEPTASLTGEGGRPALHDRAPAHGRRPRRPSWSATSWRRCSRVADHRHGCCRTARRRRRGPAPLAEFTPQPGGRPDGRPRTRRRWRRAPRTGRRPPATARPSSCAGVGDRPPGHRDVSLLVAARGRIPRVVRPDRRPAAPSWPGRCSGWTGSPRGEVAGARAHRPHRIRGDSAAPGTRSVMSCENRKEEGLFLETADHPQHRGDRLAADLPRRASSPTGGERDLVSLYNPAARHPGGVPPGRLVGQLSGGNQQKVQAWPSGSPPTATFLIVDEPTVGIDVAHQRRRFPRVDRRPGDRRHGDRADLLRPGPRS